MSAAGERDPESGLGEGSRGEGTFLVVGSAALRSLQVIPTDHLCVVRFLLGRKKSKGLLEFEGGE